MMIAQAESTVNFLTRGNILEVNQWFVHDAHREGLASKEAQIIPF